MLILLDCLLFDICFTRKPFGGRIMLQWQSMCFWDINYIIRKHAEHFNSDVSRQFERLKCLKKVPVWNRITTMHTIITNKMLRLSYYCFSFTNLKDNNIHITCFYCFFIVSSNLEFKLGHLKIIMLHLNIYDLTNIFLTYEKRFCF